MSKPEYNPTSIKFKIQLAAFYHIPEIVIFKLANAPLMPGTEYNFVLKLVNPTQHATNVDFLNYDSVMLEKSVAAEQESTETSLTQTKDSEKAVSAFTSQILSGA